MSLFFFRKILFPTFSNVMLLYWISSSFDFRSICKQMPNRISNFFFFGDVTLCRTANIYGRFGRLWCLHLQSSNKRLVLPWHLVLEVLGITMIRNLDSHLPSDKALTTHMTAHFSNLAKRRTYIIPDQVPDKLNLWN